VSTVAFAGEHLPERTNFALLPLDEVESPSARYGIALWRTLRGERRFPARGDLNLREIAPIMRHMSLVAVIDGGADFENGFVGDVVVRAHDVPIAHRRFSDVARDMPTLMGGVTPLFRQVVETGLPLAYRGRTGHDMAHVVYTDFEGVLLPLGETDDAVDHVVYVGMNTVAAAPSPPKNKA
jgi:hypothetical protein